MNRSPTFSSVIVCSTGSLLIVPEFSTIYKWVAMVVSLMLVNWRGSLIPYEVVNKCPRVRENGDGDLLHCPGSQGESSLALHWDLKQLNG